MRGRRESRRRKRVGWRGAGNGKHTGKNVKQRKGRGGGRDRQRREEKRTNLDAAAPVRFSPQKSRSSVRVIISD